MDACKMSPLLFFENSRLVTEILMAVSCALVVHHDCHACQINIKFPLWGGHSSLLVISWINVVGEKQQFSHGKLIYVMRVIRTYGG